MKINETGRIGRIDHYRKQDANTAYGGLKKGKKKDEVQISAEAKVLHDNVKNQGKIDELKQAVSTGTYRVDSHKIAEKLYPYLK